MGMCPGHRRLRRRPHHARGRDWTLGGSGSRAGARFPGQRHQGQSAGPSTAAGLPGSCGWRQPVSAYAPGLPSRKAGSVMSLGQASLAARWVPVISADRCRDLRIRSIGGNCRFRTMVGKLRRNEGLESRLGSMLARRHACSVSRHAISSDIGAPISVPEFEMPQYCGCSAGDAGDAGAARGSSAGRAGGQALPVAAAASCRDAPPRSSRATGQAELQAAPAGQIV